MAALGFCDVTLHKMRDDEAEMKALLQELLSTKDVLLLTDGVSAGNFDFVPKLPKECQVQEIFHKVAQRPGMPLWFGKTQSDVYVFGLPGNPVSCLVNLRKYVNPIYGRQTDGHPFKRKWIGRFFST
ncbi:MAG: molybdopterin-binding protein [Bacteriovoracaceae bacterium]|nr:molybdopterin-binding protein [Bacteriovoracaceae bacterium]